MVKKYWYVYKITHKVTKNFYIGYRGCRLKNPLNDIGKKYFTSGQAREHFKSYPQDYICEVLFTSGVERDAFWYEQSVISASFKNRLCMNKGCSNQLNKLPEVIKTKKMKCGNKVITVTDHEYAAMKRNVKPSRYIY